MNRQPIHSDKAVLIIGSGPCGIAVADTLRSQGVSSIVFEAGPLPIIHDGISYRNMEEYRQQLKAYLFVNDDEWRYETNSKDFDWIRVRAAGGRTLRWNGWLAHPRKENFISAESQEWQWPFTELELEKLLTRSKKWLNGQASFLASRYVNLKNQLGCVVLPKAAAMAENLIRPFCSLDRLSWSAYNSQTSAQIRLEDRVIVTSILCGRDGVEGVEYIDCRTRVAHRIKARVVILSASTIETTRILLCSELNRSEAYTKIGKGYTDHIAASYLAILPDKFKGDKIASPLARGATIPNPLNSHRSLLQRGGFSIELHGPNPAEIYEPEVLAVAGLDAVKDADVSCISVNAIGELCSSPRRYVGISDQVDSLGRKIPKISLEWDEEVKALVFSMEAEAKRVATELAGTHGHAVKVRETLTLGGTGTSHEASTCQIGIDANHSVVDRDGQVHGIKGLFIADASLLPSGLDCHPTLTIVSLALNTADGVIRSLMM